MRKIALLASAVALSAFASVAPAEAGSILYANDYLLSGSPGLYTVDVGTGAATRVGTIDTSIGDLTSDNADRLWGINIARNQLVRIDPATGATISAVSLPTGSGVPAPVVSIAYDASSGFLYGVTTKTFSNSKTLVTIDPNSGAIVTIGNLSGSTATSGDNIYGLAFSSTGVLYGWDDATLSLYTIDTTTAALTNLGNTPGDGSMYDFAFRPEDGLMYASDAAAGRLVYNQLTPTNAQLLIGSYGLVTSNIAGMAFLEVPEPATMAVLGIGLAGLGVARRRRR